ncbi:MAG: bifunctional oligoribonuclease/PAP phosphatase NrnA [Clostridia bacterium]|nr:bifunctional oligoribonuclease/PAP phosphatase NrnA [Clostridia bacterium]
MSMENITLEKAAEMLIEQDNILILMHKSPDGDTIGSGYALCLALRKAGKKAQAICSDPIPSKYGYITDSIDDQSFEPDFIVSTDIAAPQLFGDKLSAYTESVDLCIDHHGSNTRFAKYSYIEPSAAACAQIIAKLIPLMGTEIDAPIADALFTGISTDTGCFKFRNTTAETYRAAAEMIERGARNYMITTLMFDTKSRQQLELEKRAIETLDYRMDGKIAIITITTEMMAETGAEESDTDYIVSLPRQIEGVMAGVTIKQKGEKLCRISVRASDGVDASEICSLFGGGGHKGAAGCSIEASPAEAKEMMASAIEKVIGK